MPGICFLYTWKQHSHCLNLNLSLNHGLGRHVHVLYVLPCCKKLSPYILITGDGICNIPLDIDYWWRDLSPLRLSGKPGGRRSYDVSPFFAVFSTHACHRDEGFVTLAGFFAGFTGWCLSTTSSVSGGGSHVGMTTFSFHWITTEFLMKSHIYWYLKCYPFLWSYCDKIVFPYFMCTISQTLLLSTSLLLGSFSYVFNIIIILTCIVSICRF